MSYQNNREEYLKNSVMSASPAALLVMLYDRAILDIRRAESAVESGNPHLVSGHLIHAQDIVTELTNSLDVTVWEGGAQLRALYLHLYSALLTANLTKSSEEMAECREILEELRVGWREAAAMGAGAPTQTGGGLGVG